MPARVTILGYYGRGNLGDEALLQCALDACRSRVPDADIAVLAFDAGRVERDFQVTAIPAVGTSSRWRRLRRLAANDLLVIGGGGLFKDWGRDFRGMAPFAVPALWSRAWGRAVALAGVGVGPVLHPFSSRLLGGAVRYASSVWVRDRGSRDWVSRVGGPIRRLRLAPDPALLLPPAPPGAGEADWQARVGSFAGRLWIGVNLRHWYKRDFRVRTGEAERMELLCRRLAEGVSRLAARASLGVITLPFRVEWYDDDRRAMDLLVSRLPPSVACVRVQELLSPGLMIGFLARCTLLVGMRLHASLLAATAGTPFLSLEYDEKVTGALEQIGRTTDGVEMSPAEIDRLPDRLEAAWEGRERAAADLRARRTQWRLAIEEAWDEVFAPVGGGGRANR
ncbi:MAG: polysaccharide pyruvyl transferase family protein [Planctomycetes bacterium]|nr:polysaccharide pyruvyl transferase family protein [Planctomycetota bacterium]